MWYCQGLTAWDAMGTVLLNNILKFYNFRGLNLDRANYCITIDSNTINHYYQII